MEDIIPILRAELNLTIPDAGRRRQTSTKKAKQLEEQKAKKSASKTPAVVDKRKVQMKASANKKAAAKPSVQRYTRRREDPDELTR